MNTPPLVCCLLASICQHLVSTGTCSVALPQPTAQDFFGKFLKPLNLEQSGLLSFELRSSIPSVSDLLDAGHLHSYKPHRARQHTA